MSRPQSDFWQHIGFLVSVVALTIAAVASADDQMSGFEMNGVATIESQPAGLGLN